MKHLIIILVGALFLSACQQEAAKDTDKQVEAAQIKAEPVATEQSEHKGHDHEAELDSKVGENGKAKPASGPTEKFRTVEDQMACEQPVVIEFFAYQCPHCYDLETAAKAWREKNAGKVKFLSVPTHLGANEFGSLLLVHHAAEKLGVLEKTQSALFERVHKEKKLFGSPEEAADFLAAQGADKEKAIEVLADQEAMGKIIESDFGMMANYKITHVPQVMVNHQYITDVSSAGGQKEVFDLVDELLKREHSCKPAS